MRPAQNQVWPMLGRLGLGGGGWEIHIGQEMSSRAELASSFLPTQHKGNRSGQEGPPDLVEGMSQEVGVPWGLEELAGWGGPFPESCLP